jgi:hypothetical protein
MSFRALAHVGCETVAAGATSGPLWIAEEFRVIGASNVGMAIAFDTSFN